VTHVVSSVFVVSLQLHAESSSLWVYYGKLYVRWPDAFLAFKFHHTSENLFMTTEVEYNWNFFKMWKFFNSQFTSSTAISYSQLFIFGT